MAQYRLFSRRNVVIGGMAATGAAVAIRQYRLIPPDYAGDQLSVAEAYHLAQDGSLLLVDIRTPREWRATGLGAGAHPVDMRREDFEQKIQSLAQGDRAARIALICARGVRSARMSNALSDAGFTNIVDVPEGMLGSAAGPGWVRTGLPVQRYDEGTG